MPGQGRRLIGKEACMRRILMLSLIAAAAAACAPSSGELVVDWTFGGLTCADAGVATINMDVAGEVLSPDHFSCAQAPVGVSLGVYDAGDYQVTITGLDATGVVTHQITQTLRVVGGRNNEFALDVPRVAETTGSANMTWTFDGKSCVGANVNKVTIFVDPDASGNGGINAGTVACSTMGTDGASVEGLTPGTHTFAIQGLQTLSDGDHLRYRTHQPASGYFAVGAITDVFVSAESLP
jgi:hypothetical protein